MTDGAHDRSAGSGGNKAGERNGISGQERPVLVAVDLGAESCRVSLLRWVDGQAEIRLIHRFANSAKNEGNGLRWDIGAIVKGVEDGLRACAQLAPEGIAAVGVDGWAVDYVRLGPKGEPTGNPYCYRDERTLATLKDIHSRISPQRLYELTGVQILSLNTLYQLRADRESEQSLPWVNVPEYLMHRLGGRRVSEYTNATHTQLLGVEDHAWCAEIFAAAGLDLRAAPPVVSPGKEIGRLQGPLASVPALRNTKLIAPACHDTASAIAGIPAQGEDWAFISSGTWSLVGCVLDSPCTSDAARSANFSNEGGVGGKIYFLKNVNGMWLLRQCMEQWRLQGQAWTVEQLIDACAGLDAPGSVARRGRSRSAFAGRHAFAHQCATESRRQGFHPRGRRDGRADGELDFSQPGGPLCRSFAECEQHHGEDFEAAIRGWRREQEYALEQTYGQGHRA